MTQSPVPKSTAHRISLYLRQVEALRDEGRETISSEQLAARLGLTATQVRKDLGHFGQLGRPGVGYECEDLLRRLKVVLGTDRVRSIVLVGAGNLGRALASYRGFERRGFQITAVFDNDPQKVGRQVGPHIVQHISKLAFVCRRDEIRLAVLAVPGPAAQDVVDLLARSGVQGVLNFAPATLTAPGELVVTHVSLSVELEQLGLAVRWRQGDGPATEA